MRPVRDERGSATELALAVPLLVMMLLLPAYLARLTQTRAEVDGAARDAARAASIARTPSAATTAAYDAAAADLKSVGVSCQSFAVVTDTTDFRPDGSVRVEVTCTIALGDLGLLGVPASKTLSARFVAPVDKLRGTA